MKPFPISQSLRGEKVAAVIPAPATFVPDSHRRARLNLFPGRHLTREALTNEHDARLQRLLLRGQAVGSGIVQGFEVLTQGTDTLTFGPGFGLTASGEDVTLDRTWTIPAGDLPVFDLVQGRITARLGDLPVPCSKPQAGVLLWQPVSIQDDDLPSAAVPEGFDQNFSPCERQPADEAFYRRTVVDAARVVLCFWPEDWRPQPAFSNQWRNQLAWEVFRAERSGKPMPWQAVGVPVALVGFDTNYRPIFVDRHAVVRPGGRPRIRPLRANAGEPRLWQAQADQFAAQLSDLASKDSGLVNFRIVPPVGLLPKAFFELKKSGTPVQWNITQSFFPPTYTIEVAVAPLEQLDLVFEDARSLEPFDLTSPDAVRLLLAVSQRFFDPQLLEIASISKDFLSTVNAMIARQNSERVRRKNLREKDAALHKALTAQALEFPPDDPPQVNLEPPEEAYGTSRVDNKLTVDAIEEIRKALPKHLKRFDEEGKEVAELNSSGLSEYRAAQERIQTDEAGALERLGLRGFIAYLESKVDRADSLVDRGFLKINADVYRLGQFMGNNALGTQFAASASLANAVARDPAPATPGGVNLFASRLFADLVPTTTQATAGTVAGTQPASAGAAPAGAPIAVMANRAALTASAGTFLRLPLNDFLEAGEVLNTGAGRAQLEALDRLVADNTDARTAFENLKKASVTQPETLAQVKNLAQFADAYVPNFNSVTPKQLRAIPFERLPAPAAPKIRQDIFTTKLEVFDQLMQLDLSLAELTTDFVESSTTTAPPAGETPASANRTITLFKFNRLINARELDKIDSTDADEAGHFSRGVKHADMSIAALRAVEARIKLYRELIELCRANLTVIEGNQARLRTRLQGVDDAVSEAIHDVAVAEALKREEEARIQGLNDHREAILRHHVTFGFFHRPRAIEARADTPVRVIEPALRVQPVPACLEEDLPQPPDLAALSEAFLGSPARWFKHAPIWIAAVNRIDHLRDLMVRSTERTIPVARTIPVVSAGRQAAALTRVLAARAVVSTRFAPVLHAFNPTVFTTLSWQDLSRRAHELLTLGHLINAGPAHLARAAAAELNDLFKIGACLHRSFSQVTPFLRLLWAERYSEFDGPADFRDLSRLPRWTEVPFTLRREMQIHADWLYSRVDAHQPDALELIHDLIRVGLLLASHAPVDQLITGTVAESTIPATGGLLKLNADPLRIRIGMQVVLQQSNQALVHAVVEDIGAGQVSARITKVPVPTQLDPARTTVRFEEPATSSPRR